MNKFNHSASAMANSGSAKTVSRRAETVSISQVIAKKLADLFPLNTSGQVSKLIGISKTQANRRLSGKRRFNDNEIFRLLDTDQGLEILAAGMAQSRVRWWRLVLPLMECAEAQRLQTIARRRIRKVVEGAIDADADITAALARADALLIHDEDFHGANADAVRAVARVPHRAVAPATKKRG